MRPATRSGMQMHVSYLLIAAVSLGASEPLIDDHPIVSVSAAAAAAY